MQKLQFQNRNSPSTDQSALRKSGAAIPLRYWPGKSMEFIMKWQEKEAFLQINRDTLPSIIVMSDWRNFFPLIALKIALTHRGNITNITIALWLSFFSTTTVQYNTRIIIADATIHLSMSRSILLSLVKKIPRYLNSFDWYSNSLPNGREQFTIYRQRTMASDLEMSTSQLLHSACWRSQYDEASRISKKRDAHLWFPNIW